MSTLASVVVYDVIANLPAAGIPGRLFFASDTGIALRDNGTTWNTLMAGTVLEKTLSAAPGAPGDFTIAHGLSAAPSRISILMTSGGAIWAQATAFDGTNVYLVASAGGITARVAVFA